jgi:hypothetical protein
MNNEMWKEIAVDLTFKNRVMGGVPKSQDIIKAWIDARRMKDAKFEKQKAEGIEHKPLDVIAKEVGEATTPEQLLANKEEASWVGFLADDLGIYAREHQIKGHLKDCANQVKKLKGNIITALRDKVANKVYLAKEKNYFNKGENFIKEPDGSFEHGIRVDTPMGKRSALKRNDYIDDASLSFGLKVFNDGMINIEILTTIFEYGSVHGIFSERAHGYGKYSFTIREA